MSFSSFPYRSPKKFKPTPTKSTSTLRSTHQSKEEWNTYLTDDDKFRLTNEEILRRKQQLISKHNILLNPSSIVTTPSSPSTTLSSFHKTSSSSIIKKSKLKKSKLNSNDKTKEEMMSKGKGKDKLLKEFTSLDLLNNYSELEITDDDYDDVHEEDNQEEEEELTESEYYTNELNSKRKEKKTTRKHFENKEKSSKPSISINKYSKKTVLHTQQSPQVAQKDLKDITTMIQALHQELKYYEELSGRRSFLDLNELNSVLDLSSNDTISYTTTMRYLVQLVCQTMSYLLKSEIELNKQRDNYTLLSERVDHLFSLQHSQKPMTSFNNLSKPFENYPMTPSTSNSTPSEGINTERSDKTVNLYEKESSNIQVTTPSSMISSTTSRNSTPYQSFMTESTSASKRKGQVTFSLPSQTDLNPYLDGTSPAPFRESKLGTSSTDWLFQTTKDILANPPSSSTNTSSIPVQHTVETEFHSTTSPDTGKAIQQVANNSSQMYPPSRLTELQQQIAIMKHDITGVKGYGITNEVQMTPPSTQSSTFSAYHSDPLKQWLKWTGESPQQSRGVMSVRPMNPLDDLNNLSIPPPPPPPISSYQGDSMKTIHIPHTHIPPKNIIEESNSESEEDESEIPLHQIYDPNTIPTPSSRLASYRQVSQPSNIHEQSEETPSQHVIPSTSLPTPERAPQHPRSSSSSSSSSSQYHHTTSMSIPLYPPSAKPLSPNSSFVPLQRSYDARNGSYGGR